MVSSLRIHYGPRSPNESNGGDSQVWRGWRTDRRQSEGQSTDINPKKKNSDNARNR
jgi:hypothetical protein